MKESPARSTEASPNDCAPLLDTSAAQEEPEPETETEAEAET